MSKFDDIARKAQNDKTFLGSLAADPKAALQSAGIELTDAKDIHRAEAFARVASENVSAAARIVGIDPGDAADWGIGAGCCSKKTLEIGEQ